MHQGSCSFTLSPLEERHPVPPRMPLEDPTCRVRQPDQEVRRQGGQQCNHYHHDAPASNPQRAQRIGRHRQACKGECGRVQGRRLWARHSGSGIVAGVAPTRRQSRASWARALVHALGEWWTGKPEEAVPVAAACPRQHSPTPSRLWATRHRVGQKGGPPHSSDSSELSCLSSGSSSAPSRCGLAASSPACINFKWDR